MAKTKTARDPYVMTDEKLIHAIANKLPTPFGERFDKLYGMTRAELIEEYLRHYELVGRHVGLP